MRAFGLLLLLTSCATLDTANMTAACRDLYNACLNSCPSSNGRAPPPPVGNPTNLQTDVARCTNDCNERAKQCR